MSFALPGDFTAPTVPARQIVILNMTSVDVTHSFSLPALDVAKDVQPRFYTQLWFNATNTGVFINAIHCKQLCGVGHTLMLANLTVVEPASYQTWYSKVGGGK